MPRPSSISPEQGEALLIAYLEHGSQRAAAAAVGVSEDAANRYFRNLPRATTQVIAQQAHILTRMADTLWHTRDALQANYERVLSLYERLERGIVEQHGENVTDTPISTHIAALKELREHIKLGAEVQKTLLDVEQIKRFQEIVLSAIGDADHATQQRIIATLRQHSALPVPAGLVGAAGGHTPAAPHPPAVGGALSPD